MPQQTFKVLKEDPLFNTFVEAYMNCLKYEMYQALNEQIQLFNSKHKQYFKIRGTMRQIILKTVSIFMLILYSYGMPVTAQSPYGHYICRYILTKDNNKVYCHNIYNPLTISHYGIRVENTNAGVKTWKIEYKGASYKSCEIMGSNKYLFHLLYLTNQFVNFWISDEPIFPLNRKSYFVINFDGQIQLAERRTK